MLSQNEPDLVERHADAAHHRGRRPRHSKSVADNDTVRCADGGDVCNDRVIVVGVHIGLSGPAGGRAATRRRSQHAGGRGGFLFHVLAVADFGSRLVIVGDLEGSGGG